MSRVLPEHGTTERYRLELRVDGHGCPACCEANAERVRKAYHADPRAKELTRERGRRYRERHRAQQKAERQARMDAWVQSVVGPKGQSASNVYQGES